MVHCLHVLLLVRHPARVRVWLEVRHTVSTDAAAITVIRLALLWVRKLLCCQEEQLRRRTATSRPTASPALLHAQGGAASDTNNLAAGKATGMPIHSYRTAGGQPTAIAEGRAQATPERSCMTPRSKEGGAVG